MIVWPQELRFASAAPTLSASWRSGGSALSGAEQRVQGYPGPWRVAIEDVYARGPEQIAALQAVLTRLRAGENLLAPVCERAPPAGWRMASAALTTAAALRASTLALAVDGAILTPGVLIGIGDRVHRIVEILAGPASSPARDQVAAGVGWDDRAPWSDVVGPSPEPYVVRILPTTRAAYAAGAPVALSTLRLACRLADAEAGEMPAPIGRSVRCALSLIETL